ncbi:MAG: UDP-N-acetylglucosamine 2-epimerase (non-hydrolyzing) [Actinobacteria bacterium]|nr:UDP-N-acetylglucosamine 2-epimerase (non-hydrolyzing) [Actinomycetota bacterium]
MAGNTGKKKKINVLVCMGTRPEGIKLAPVITALKQRKNNFSFKVCSTGQHREMLDQVFDFFDIVPDFDLDLMEKNQSLGYLSSKILKEIGKIFDEAAPDIVLVQGDTTTAFLTALSAFYKKIKTGHVEAGLRTYDRMNPFPEEINRQLVSRVADFHFAPTKKAFDNLAGENVDRENIAVTGNTVVDAILWSIKKIEKYMVEIEKGEPFSLLDENKKIILVTMHRRESFGKDIENVCRALKEISGSYDKIQVVYPVHLNPNVRGPVYEMLGKVKNIILTRPLGYEPFLWLMSRSYFIITDSGGVQEEAPTLKKPVLVIRKKTERTESVDIGISRLVGTETKNIVANASGLLDNEENYMKMVSAGNPYGDGHAADKILDFILKKMS